MWKKRQLAGLTRKAIFLENQLKRKQVVTLAYYMIAYFFSGFSKESFSPSQFLVLPKVYSNFCVIFAADCMMQKVI